MPAMMMRGLLLSVATTTLFGAMTMSCSDPVPPTKQGSFAVHLSAGQGMCGLAQTFIRVGDASATAHTAISDGGATPVNCSVKASGGGFAFSGTIKDQNHNILFDVSGTATPNADSTAALSLSSPDTALNAFGGTCTISVTKTDAQPSLSVAPGRIWGSITCTAITQPGTVPVKTCALSDFDQSKAGGYFVFENCEQ